MLPQIVYCAFVGVEQVDQWLRCDSTSPILDLWQDWPWSDRAPSPESFRTGCTSNHCEFFGNSSNEDQHTDLRPVGSLAQVQEHKHSRERPTSDRKRAWFLPHDQGAHSRCSAVLMQGPWTRQSEHSREQYHAHHLWEPGSLEICDSDFAQIKIITY